MPYLLIAEVAQSTASCTRNSSGASCEQDKYRDQPQNTQKKEVEKDENQASA
jgi:hypothetical protein